MCCWSTCRCRASSCGEEYTRVIFVVFITELWNRNDKTVDTRGNASRVHHQGLYSQNGQTSYRKISRKDKFNVTSWIYPIVLNHVSRLAHSSPNMFFAEYAPNMMPDPCGFMSNWKLTSLTSLGLNYLTLQRILICPHHIYSTNEVHVVTTEYNSVSKS